MIVVVLWQHYKQKHEALRVIAENELCWYIPGFHEKRKPVRNCAYALHVSDPDIWGVFGPGAAPCVRVSRNWVSYFHN